jgi:16S rRNA processing protein RimM
VQSLKRYGPLQLEGRDAVLTTQALGGLKAGTVVVTFKEVTDRTQAEQLRGLKVYILRSALPVLTEDEFYIEDLVGLRVILKDSTDVIGTITHVLNFGAGDLLEITLKDSHETLLVPFVDQWVSTEKKGDGLIALDPLYLEGMNTDA